MNSSLRVKIVVFVRDAMGNAGSGVIGNYIHCSFSSKGFGRFQPQEGANPTIGEIGKMEAVSEERIEVVCDREKLKQVIEAMRAVHPYDEVAFDVYALEEV